MTSHPTEGAADPTGGSAGSDVEEGQRLVPADLNGARVDRAVAELFELPVATARRLLEAGRVRVDGAKRKKGEAVKAGQALALEGGGRWLAPAADARVRVLRLEADRIVVDKPAGMPCHPLVPGEGGTVVDALAALHPEIEAASPEAPREAGLAHRLDTGTSGCLVVARTPTSWRALREAFASDRVEKRYLALVEGSVGAKRVVEEPIGHDPSDSRRMRVDPLGRAARSEVRPLVSGPRATLVEVLMQGGRRHQLRVHLAQLGHPIVGDVLYGAAPAADALLPLLHCRALVLPGNAPITAPLPAPMLAAARARGLAVEADHP